MIYSLMLYKGQINEGASYQRLNISERNIIMKTTVCSWIDQGNAGIIISEKFENTNPDSSINNYFKKLPKER